MRFYRATVKADKFDAVRPLRCRSGQVFVIFSTMAVAASLVSVAEHASPPIQQGSTAALHQRGDSFSSNTQEPAGNSKTIQPSTLPHDISGAYDFDHLNESIEIDIDRNKLSGYISRLGDEETDSTTPLTFFFDRTSVNGAQLEFQTRVVHGLWYSFYGTVVRGQGKTRDDEGYYVLHGVLLEHHPQGGEEKSADETIVRRTVNFKSMAQ